MTTNTRQIAVVGAGRWGQNLIRTFNEINALHTIVETNAELAEQMRLQYPEINVTDNLEKVLQSDLPAIAIATPVNTHFQVAKACLEAKKHVFLEKPMSESSSQAHCLVETAKANQCTLMIGHLLLYQPAIQFIKKFIADGKLGHVHSLNQVRRNLGRIRTFENALYSLGVHDLAVLSYLVDSEVEKVTAVGTVVTNPGIEDDVTVHLNYKSGIKAHLNVNWLWPFLERHLTILGSKGALHYNEVTGQVTFYENYGNADATVTKNGSTIVFESDEKPLKLECQHFIDCYTNGKTPSSPGEQGARVIALMERATQQLTEGRSHELHQA